MNEAGPMDADTAEMVEAVGASLTDGDIAWLNYEPDPNFVPDKGREFQIAKHAFYAAIAAARPFILEEAAKVAGGYYMRSTRLSDDVPPCREIAAAIRSLAKDGGR